MSQVLDAALCAQLYGGYAALTSINQLPGELLADTLGVYVGANLDEEGAEEHALAVMQSGDGDAGGREAHRVRDEEFLRID